MAFAKFKTLLGSAGFQSYLWALFLGAFNDNAFKIVLSLVAVNVAATRGGGALYVSMVGAVFIIPFLLFSGYAGAVADSHNKRTVLITTKLLEIAVTLAALFAFFTGEMMLMLATLFMMALQSTFLSPAKYGILPEMLPATELSRANALLEMATFLAIILGTAAGTLLYSAWSDDMGLIGLALVVIAGAGAVLSFGIPRVAPAGGPKPFSINPLSEIGRGLKTLKEEKPLFLTVLLISYFWFLGALVQMDILLLGKEVMHLTDLRVGILITLLAVGIGSGSLVAGRLSGDKIEAGLVPLGSFGISLSALLLSQSSSSYTLTLAFLFLLGFSGGLFIVPLNAHLQHKSPAGKKGRLIATNNFTNTLGILLASAALWFLRDIIDLQADTIIAVFGLATIIMTIVVVLRLPDFSLRFAIWLLTHTVYRIRIAGRENIPQTGPALLVANHVSFVDALLIGACMQRFVRFMVYEHFYNHRWLRLVMRTLKAVPVADGTSREIIQSIKNARSELAAGHVVCIFAEGMITRTGNLLPFKKGFEKIASGMDVPVIPVHLDGVWGSVFSFKKGKFFWKRPEKFPYPVTVSFGLPMKASATCQEARQAVAELASTAMGQRVSATDMLHLRFVKAARRRLGALCMADSTGRELTCAKALVGSIILSGVFSRIDPGKYTAVMLPASAGGALANVALSMAGVVPVNLNFTAGEQSVSEALEKCGSRTVVTSRAFIKKAALTGLASKLESSGARIIYMEDIAGEVRRSRKLLTAAAVYLLPARLLQSIYCKGKRDSERLATVVFTSGSTGEPKGVMLTHKNILANVEGFSQLFHISGADTLIGALPFFHSFGFTATIWFPLLTGIGVAYHPNPMDAPGIGSLAASYRGSILMGTPTFFSAYTQKCTKEQFSHLRYAVAGAEKLRAAVAEEFRKKFSVELMEGYGCTELSPVVSVNTLDAVDKDVRQTGFKPGTVGCPIPGVAVKVVDPETGNELAPGTPGLLLVKGPGVMAGYLGEPEMTRRVIKDGWYVTGDIASMDNDGFITLTDRVSRFSKIAGEMVPHIRIEESICRMLPGCGCTVTAVEDEKRGERIVAFYDSAEVEPAELWTKLVGSQMPRLWIPRKECIFRVEEIPRTATGKTDLKRVREMAESLAARK